MAKSIFKVVKQIVIRPNKSPQTLISNLGKEKTIKNQFSKRSLQDTIQHNAIIHIDTG
jgi:hypothetical protein